MAWAVIESVPGQRSASSGSPGRPTGIRAISRAVSASASGLAAVAVSEPELLVLDEPTRGIDPERKAELADWLIGYAERGNAVLVVTHDRQFPHHRAVRPRRTGARTCLASP